MRRHSCGTVFCIKCGTLNHRIYDTICRCFILFRQLDQQLIILDAIQLSLISHAGKDIIILNIRPYQPLIASLHRIKGVLESPVGISPVEISTCTDLIGIPGNQSGLDQMIGNKPVQIISLGANTSVVPQFFTVCTLLLVKALIRFINIKHWAKGRGLRHPRGKTVMRFVTERFRIYRTNCTVIPV